MRERPNGTLGTGRKYAAQNSVDGSGHRAKVSRIPEGKMQE